MAIVKGALAGDILLGDAKLRSAAAVADALSGARTVKTVPVPVTSNIEAGAVAGLYGDNDWFGRLHMLPARIDVGTVRQPASEQVRLYNAGDATETIASVDKTNDSGISIDHPAPPFDLGPRKSALYNIDVLLSGPETINAAITFNGATAALLYIVGRRLLAQVWPIPPDWSDPVIERWIWMTDVQRARAGNESRRAVYPNARRGMYFNIISERIALLDRLLSGWQSRLFNVPRWQDRSYLTAPATAGASQLFLDTSVGEWRVNTQLVLLGEDLTHESPVIESIAPDSITLSNPLENDWPIGSSVYPARLMYIPQRQDFMRRTAGLVMGEVEFIADEDTTTTYEAVDTVTLFDDLPVYLVEPNRVTDALAGYERAGVRLDAPGGILLVDDPDADPIHNHQWQFNYWTREDADTFIAWLLARRGRANAFWFPTWSVDLELTTAIDVDELFINVEPIEWVTYYQGRANRDVVALQDITGAWRFARILDASIVDGQETLTLDRALVPSPGEKLEIEDVQRVCWLEKVRLDADAIEIAWLTDSIIQSTLALRGVE